ncbi:MAG: hypothetical protein R3B98_02620 [Hyphomonas sp.]
MINSALVYFSSLWGEFHPSVEPRFNEEAARRFASLYRPTFDLSEDRSLNRRLMNEAALQTARRFPAPEDRRRL